MPNGVDGELMVRNAAFNKVSSGIMKRTGEPDFFYAVFDKVTDSDQDPLNTPFHQRIKALEAEMKERALDRVWMVPQKLVKTADELRQWEEKWLAEGYEGAMVRDPQSSYNCGRSDALLKVKRFVDAEAEVIGYAPLLHNGNSETRDAFGYAKHSHRQENLVEMPLLGNLKVRDLKTKVVFEVGTGFSEQQRILYWQQRDTLMGRIIVYKSQKCGAVDKPRFPVWKGWRDPKDMGGE